MVDTSVVLLLLACLGLPVALLIGIGFAIGRSTAERGSPGAGLPNRRPCSGG